MQGIRGSGTEGDCEETSKKRSTRGRVEEEGRRKKKKKRKRIKKKRKEKVWRKKKCGKNKNRKMPPTSKSQIDKLEWRKPGIVTS